MKQRTKLAGLWAGLALVLAGHACAAAGVRFDIVTSDDSELTQRIAVDLRQRLSQQLSALAPTAKAGTIHIAIGPLALRTLATRSPDGVVIAAYTSSQVWNSIMSGKGVSGRASAIYAEPAPQDQLRLIALLYKKPVNISVILSPDTSFLQALLERAAGNSAVPLTYEWLAPNESINAAMTRIGQARVLLAMPDPNVYNGDTIRNILLSSYRHNQAVIGFSADMVQAGALASTYSDIEQINAQLGEMASSYATTGVLPAPQFPRYFKTVLNEGVARSLGVNIDAAVRKFSRLSEQQP